MQACPLHGKCLAVKRWLGDAENEAHVVVEEGAVTQKQVTSDVDGRCR